MKYPKFLTANNNVLFIAPSFGCTTEPYMSRLKKSFDVFKDQGFNPEYGPNAFSSIGFRSNLAPLCAKEFNEGYKGKYALLSSVGGGNLESEILEYVQFNELKELEPKWFMGYSDNTNLTFPMTTIMDVATIYAGCAAEFGTDELHESQLDVFKFLRGEKLSFRGYDKFELNPLKSEENPYLPYNLTEKKVLINHPDKINMEGRLLGGCIDCLTYLIGTPYDKVEEFSEKYKEDGIIWFLEACDLEAWNLKLALLQMKRHGWFKNAKGFIFGRSYKMNNTFFSIDMHNAIYDTLSDLELPIIMDADFGHLKPQMPMICGAYAKVKSDENIEIEYILK